MNEYDRLIDFPFLDHHDWAGIVLACEGLKPVSGLVFLDKKPEGFDRFFWKYVPKTLKICAWLSVFADEDGDLSFNCNMSQSMLNLKKMNLIDTLWSIDSSRLHFRGMLYGYPETATRAFGSGESIEWDTVPELLQNTLTPEELHIYRVNPFFRLSKQHWHKEVHVLKHWISVVKEKAPRVYRHLLLTQPQF